jgi:hypothetical protein
MTLTNSFAAQSAANRAFSTHQATIRRYTNAFRGTMQLRPMRRTLSTLSQLAQSNQMNAKRAK